MIYKNDYLVIFVSTHSHPKVAAVYALKILTFLMFQHTATRRWLLAIDFIPNLIISSFNTQPPEGGCKKSHPKRMDIVGFQHTATRRWLLCRDFAKIISQRVSTHSHPKVAAGAINTTKLLKILFQHTATRRWLPTKGRVSQK